jgi:hypothetical protein
MSPSYAAGLAAGRRRVAAGECPYEGHTDASMELQRRWMRGWFDGMTERRRRKRKVGKSTPRGGRPKGATTRYLTPRKWTIRSEYARRRVVELFEFAP